MTEDEARARVLAADVSRETLSRLDTLTALIRKWTRKINLISPTTVDHIWSRHILDSAQLAGHAPICAPAWADLGSGGGLPGLVIAALRSGADSTLTTTLIESDQRKCAFLATAAREMNVSVDILPQRIETTTHRTYDVVSARALAPLDRLLELASPLVHETGRMLFLKGAKSEAELTSARKRWHMDVVAHPSLTDPAAMILDVRRAIRRHEPHG